MVARSEPVWALNGHPVGPVTALSLVTVVDDPSRLRRSGDVAARLQATRVVPSTFLPVGDTQ